VASDAFGISAKRILIYGPSFAADQPAPAGDEEPNERSIAVGQGYTVDVKNATDWSAMQTAQFSSYNAVVIPDYNHHHDIPVGTEFDVADSTKTTWSPAVTGPKVVFGTDPIFHQHTAGTTERYGAVQLMRNSLNFAASERDAGLYVALSIHYYNAATPTSVTFLSGVAALQVVAATSNVATVVPGEASHPVLAGLTSADLSDWGSSVHEIFTSMPALWKRLAVEGTDPTANRAYIIADR
jgi:hypothetical protein